MKMKLFSVVIVILVTILPPCYEASEEENKLLKNLLDKYNKDARPVLMNNETVQVEVKHTMTQILNIDEQKEVFVSSGWVSLSWKDNYLTWEPNLYKGIKKLYLNPRKIWVPDVALYGNVETAVFGNRIDQFQNKLAINYNGKVLWELRATFVIKCHYNIYDFPFDVQSCTFKYGSWSYEKGKLDINPRSRFTVENGALHYGWTVLNTSSLILERKFTTNVYENIHFSVTFKRRAICHTLTVILPPLIVGTLVLLTFLLPAASGGRLTFSVTLLLSMIFYMVSTSRLVPRDDATIPLIYKFFIATLIEIFFVHVFLILNSQHYYKKAYDPPMPRWMSRYVLNRLSFWLGVRTKCKHIDPMTPETDDLMSIIEIGLINGTANSLKTQLSAHQQLTEDEILKEWRIVAMTIDRCSFFIFSFSFLVIILVFSLKSKF